MHLLTGATGYVGGRLLGRLERDGSPVRCLCRNPEALIWRVTPDIELMQGDLLQPESLVEAFSGVDTAFYLVHSMQDGPSSKPGSTGPLRTSHWPLANRE